MLLHKPRKKKDMAPAGPFYSSPDFERHHTRWVSLHDALQRDPEPDPVVFLRLWHAADTAFSCIGWNMPSLEQELLDVMECHSIAWGRNLQAGLELPENDEEDENEDEDDDNEDFMPARQIGSHHSTARDEKERSGGVNRQERQEQQAGTTKEEPRPAGAAARSRPAQQHGRREITGLVKHMYRKSMQWQENIYWILLSREKPGFNFQHRFWEI